MSYDSDSDNQQDLDYQKHRARKEKDLYLLETVKLLNDGCANAVKYADPKTRVSEEVKLYNWDIDDIDYDFEECRNYCLYEWPWDVCPGEYRLCNSCHTIIKNRIHKPFTKSKSELIYDSILLQEQINNVLERLAKLESTCKA